MDERDERMPMPQAEHFYTLADFNSKVAIPFMEKEKKALEERAKEPGTHPGDELPYSSTPGNDGMEYVTEVPESAAQYADKSTPKSR